MNFCKGVLVSFFLMIMLAYVAGAFVTWELNPKEMFGNWTEVRIAVLVLLGFSILGNLRAEK